MHNIQLMTVPKISASYIHTPQFYLNSTSPLLALWQCQSKACRKRRGTTLIVFVMAQCR